MLGQLAGRRLAKPACVIKQPAICGIPALGKFFIHDAAQARDRAAEFIGPAGRLAEPERNIGRLALCVRHPHLALFDLEDSIGGIAQLKDVAGQALESEVFVQCPDKMSLRFQHHIVIELIRNHPAVGHGSESGAFPGSDALVNRVIVDVTAAPAAPGRKALCQHVQQFREFLPGHVPVGVGQRHLPVQLVLLPFPAGSLRNQVLGQHVQVACGYAEPVQFIAPRRIQQCRAFHQVVPAQREQAPLWSRTQVVAGAPDPLQEHGDGTGRAELADQVDIADIDPQFQGCGRDQGLEFTLFQSLFGIQAVFLCQTAVVRGDKFFTDPFRQGAGCTLGQAAGIDEDQRGPVPLDQVGQSPVQFLPHLPGHHGLQG